MSLQDFFVEPAESHGVALWWLGQAGFALRHGEALLVVDPYLSDTLAEKYAGTTFPHVRAYPPPVLPGSITDVGAVLCTHGHTDHMDPGSLQPLCAASDPLVVVPRAEVALAVQRGVPRQRLVPVNAGESRELLDGVQLTVVPAAHEELTVDEDGCYRHLGYVLTIGGTTVYHSGDCVPFAGQADLLRPLGIDVALLPVNGRDAFRAANGVPGNFHWHEALRLCEDAGIPTLVCHHWGLFDFNTIDPATLAESLKASGTSVRWLVPEVGERYVVEADGAVVAR